MQFQIPNDRKTISANVAHCSTLIVTESTIEIIPMSTDCHWSIIGIHIVQYRTNRPNLHLSQIDVHFISTWYEKHTLQWATTPWQYLSYLINQLFFVLHSEVVGDLLIFRIELSPKFWQNNWPRIVLPIDCSVIFVTCKIFGD